VSLIIKIITTLWPFAKEMILGNKQIRDFLIEHIWVIGNITTSLLLFLLFINQYLINVNLRVTVVEQNSTIEILKSKVAGNEWQIERLGSIQLRLDELISERADLISKLNVYESNRPPFERPRPSPPRVKRQPDPKPSPPNKKYLDKLETLIKRENQHGQ
jgi:hypothetical protein